MTASIAAGAGAPGDDPDDDRLDDLDGGLAVWRPVGRAPTRPRPRRRPVGGTVAAAFFGCVVAAGMSGLLVTLVAGLVSTLGLPSVFGEPGVDVGVSGLVGIATRTAMLGTVLVSYLSGGYVAARISGTSSALLGVAVWACGQAVGAAVLTFGAATQADGGPSSGWGGRSGSDAVGGTMATMEVSTLMAVIVTALAGAIYGSSVGGRRLARSRRAG